MAKNEMTNAEKYQSARIHDNRMTLWISHVIQDIGIDAKEKDLKLQWECNHNFGNYTMNLTLYKRNKETDKFEKIFIYKLDLGKYRITIFPIVRTSLRETISKDVSRYNFLSERGKEEFASTFMKYYTKFTTSFYDDLDIECEKLESNHYVLNACYEVYSADYSANETWEVYDELYK